MFPKFSRYWRIGVRSRSRQQLRGVASCFAALNSYDSEATAINTATASLLGGKQKDLRTLCSAKWVAGDGKQSGWGVERRDEFGDNRKDADIRRDLEKSVLRRARAYLSKIGVAEPASVLSSASRQQNDGSQTAVHQPSHGGDPDMTSQQSTAGDGAPTQGSPLSSEGFTTTTTTTTTTNSTGSTTTASTTGRTSGTSRTSRTSHTRSTTSTTGCKRGRRQMFSVLNLNQGRVSARRSGCQMLLVLGLNQKSRPHA